MQHAQQLAPMHSSTAAKACDLWPRRAAPQESKQQKPALKQASGHQGHHIPASRPIDPPRVRAALTAAARALQD